MNSTVIQHWQFSYLCVAFLVAVAAVIAPDLQRGVDVPALPIRCAAALLTGSLWPVMIIGVAQLWVISKVAGRSAPGPAGPAPRVMAAAESL